MRLRPQEQAVICSSVQKLDPNAKVYLFGSRVDDTLKGGDIDLLVMSDILGFSDKITLLVEIKTQIGEQKIDLLIRKFGADKHDAFVASILQSAVLLAPR